MQLTRFIKSPKLDYQKLLQAHLSRIKKIIPSNNPLLIYADLSDLSKPYAKKLDCLDYVRDGSSPKGEIQPGYWLNEIYLSPQKGKIFPAIFRPFSHKEKGFTSQNTIVLEDMELVYNATQNQGIWIMDRGGDNKKFFNSLLDKKHDFLVRLAVGNNYGRKLIDAHNRYRWAYNIAASTNLEFNLDDCLPNYKGQIKFNSAKVKFSHRKESLNLIIFKAIDQLKPVILLTGLPVSSSSDVAMYVSYYLDRFACCEDPIRFLKQIFSLEKFLLNSIKGIRLWFFLVQVVFSLLFELENSRQIFNLFLKLSQSFPKKINFYYYRILRGLQCFLQSYTPASYLLTVKYKVP